MEPSTSWDHAQPHHHEEESLEESAERVTELFTSTITAMAADVHALKHLSTWKDILEENEENPVDHNELRVDFMESLCDLDDVVSAVEKKVGVLRNIVAEEQRALENLNLLHKDSVEQNENLQYLVERCRNMKVTSQPAAEHNKKKTNNNKSSRSSLSKGAKPTNNHRSSTGGRYPNARDPLKSTSSSVNSEETHHTHVEGLSCHFDPVTVEELESVPRTTRGRVQVHVINEALDNIEKCFHKKALKVRKQKQLLEESRHVALARYQNAPEEHIDDEELLRDLVVTEQELRQSCAFFVAGEGTARTVLAVLKELKRIKQVPQRKKGAGFLYRLWI